MLKLEQKEKSRSAILASAAELIRENGIAGTRVSDVMEGAGLTVGAFYAHFDSKEALVDEVLHLTAHELRDRLFARLEEKPAEARAEVMLKRYLSPIHRDAHTLGCPLPAVVGEIGTRSPEHRGAVEEHLQSIVQELAKNLPEAGDARSKALGLVALMYGGLSLARAVKDTALADDILKSCRALGVAATHVSPSSPPKEQS